MLELIDTTILEDSLKCVKEHGFVCMTGIVGNKWTLNNFAPMEAIPTASYLSAYSGGSGDFMQTPLSELAEQIASGKLHVQIGKTFKLDEIVEPTGVWRKTKRGARSIYLLLSQRAELVSMCTVLYRSAQTK